jgi:7-dehydrocholesterol reductase
MLQSLKHHFRYTLSPLFLIVVCPPIAILIWHINVNLNGSLTELFQIFVTQGFFHSLYHILQPVFFGSATSWVMITIFAAIELVLMRIIPGKLVQGPETSKRHIPIYKENGVLCFVITLLLFYLATHSFHLFSATMIYDHFGEILGSLNTLSFIFCFILYIKGRLKPSTPDHSHSGNFIFDYYWGTELYPRILGWDIKVFTNCRFGMMSWSLILISFAAKQAQLYGLSNAMMVAVLLQLIYISKFYVWETGYMRSLDIMHDRAGFYICWGCMAWVPAIYTSPTLYLVNHPHHLSWLLAIVLALLGSLSIFINYSADAQRQKVRATKGQCYIWGKKPRLIEADYLTLQGEKRKALLLVSGWWGLARHFHYFPEILAAFFWSVPALFDHFIPYFYLVFLTILLVDRSFRDDIRCIKKYGSAWKEYCEQVPYRIVPGLRFGDRVIERYISRTNY